MQKYVMICVIMLGGLLANGQAGKYTEEQIKTERNFVDAKNFFLLEKYDEAISGFKSFLKDVPHNGAAANELSKLYKLKKEPIEAIEWGKKAVKWAQDNEWYVLNLVDLYQDNNDFEAAALLIDPLIAKAPSKKYYYKKQGYLYVMAQMPAKAVETYDAYLKNIGPDQTIRLKKIALLGGLGQENEAFNMLKDLVVDYPENEGILLKMGDYYRRHDEPEKAKDYFDKILAINPNNPRALRAINETNNPEMGALDALIANENVDIDLKIRQLMPYLQDMMSGKKIDGHVLDLVDVMTQIHRTDPKSYALAGDFSLHGGYIKKALTYYNQSLEINSTIFDVWLQKMDILKLLGDYKTLKHTSDDCMELYPYKAQAFLYNGIALNGLKKPHDALKSLNPAMSMSRKSASTQSNIEIEIGLAYLSLNKKEKGWSHLDKAIEKNPQNAYAYKVYSYQLSLANKDLPKAQKMAKKSTVLAPGQPEYMLNYAYILFVREEYKQAKKVLEKMLANGNADNCSILEPYGDVLYKLGDVEKAVTQWDKALNNCPKNKGLSRKVAEKKI